MHSHSSHSHEHAHAHGDGGQRALTWALILNGGFLFIEAGVGWWTNSLALLSDAAHMLSDVAALILALGAARLARRKPLRHHTFGLVRAEVMGAFLNGIALLAACAWIIWEAAARLGEPPSVPGLPMLLVGGIGLAINLGSAAALFRADRTNLNIRGALAHMLADALGSAGAMVAAVLVMIGFPIADPIVSIFIAVLVLWGARSVLTESGRVLLQLPPKGFDLDGARETLESIEGVCCVHDLHVWTLDGTRPIVTAHLIADQPDVHIRARAVLAERYQITHATLQIEPEHCGADPCAPLDADNHSHAHHDHDAHE
jgi:cobalt-zinc-cadmium efflux system protein